ncbi:hypothetical protein DFJ58DRAFT_732406 [Suillus subalutaceus]|uniref:uncharacterized protein n=1 Tax=Suillus subalutaceus TaxID=48586 RepID=UPI001B87860D|nr:uncharacterized protein DFJ58DRAFT_732406 [Suillus subalutaceus]KAG1841554.1 hypothetical protein DFJ58DRAFT_732406 [Suillus subalutaceus]
MTCSYTFVVTALIAKCINTIPGLHVRTTADGEKPGLDEVEISEIANEYIEVRRDFMDWSAFGSISAHRPSVTGDRHDQLDLAQQDQLTKFTH